MRDGSSEEWKKKSFRVLALEWQKPMKLISKIWKFEKSGRKKRFERSSKAEAERENGLAEHTATSEQQQKTGKNRENEWAEQKHSQNSEAFLWMDEKHSEKT